MSPQRFALFDTGRFHPQLRAANGADIAARAGPNDNHIVRILVAHAYLLFQKEASATLRKSKSAAKIYSENSGISTLSAAPVFEPQIRLFFPELFNQRNAIRILQNGDLHPALP